MNKVTGMKKFLIIIALALTLGGCKKDDGLVCAYWTGYQCDRLLEEVESFYNNEIEIKEIEKFYVMSDNYDVYIGAVTPGTSMGFGVYKSKTLELENLCSVSQTGAKSLTDYDGKAVGCLDNLEISRYVTLGSEIEAETYTRAEDMLSDLKGGIIDGILCLPDTAESLLEKDPDLKVWDLEESEIYEYAVFGRSQELIEYINRVIE